MYIALVLHWSVETRESLSWNSVGSCGLLCLEEAEFWIHGGDSHVDAHSMMIDSDKQQYA